jgi:hypothetical protein
MKMGKISNYILNKLEACYKDLRINHPKLSSSSGQKASFEIDLVVVNFTYYFAVAFSTYAYVDPKGMNSSIFTVCIMAGLIALNLALILFYKKSSKNPESIFNYRYTAFSPLYVLINLPLPGRSNRIKRYLAFREILNDEVVHKLQGSTDRFEKTRSAKNSLKHKMKDAFKQWSTI